MQLCVLYHDQANNNLLTFFLLMKATINCLACMGLWNHVANCLYYIDVGWVMQFTARHTVCLRQYDNLSKYSKVRNNGIVLKKCTPWKISEKQ